MLRRVRWVWCDKPSKISSKSLNLICISFFPMTYYNSKITEVIGQAYYKIVCQPISTLHETLFVPPLDERGRYKSTSVE